MLNTPAATQLQSADPADWPVAPGWQPLVDTFFATSLPQGSLTLLKMGDRLNQMPLGIFGIALGTAILPMLARHIHSDDGAEAQRLQVNAFEGRLAAIGFLQSACLQQQGVFGGHVVGTGQVWLSRCMRSRSLHSCATLARSALA